VKGKTPHPLLQWLGKLLRKPAVGCLLISLAVTGLLLFVRSMGWLQRPELIAYDSFVKSRMKPDSKDGRIVLVGMTEKDLADFGFPIPDADLAKVLNAVKAQQPAAVGLDMYRDLPEPRLREGQSSAGYDEFQKVLKDWDRIFGIERVGIVRAPAALRDTERVLANNLAKDAQVDGVFRRGPVFIEKGVPQPMQSLSLGLVLQYLDARGVDYGLENDAKGRTVLRLNKTTIPRLESDAGGYVGLEVADYEYLLDLAEPLNFGVTERNSRDPLGQFGTNTPYDFSYGDVLRGKVPAGAFTGKIVLLATVMQSIKDSNPTPIHDNFRGVQQHIAMIHQLLDMALNGSQPMRWWPEWAEMLWIVCFTLAGGGLGLWLQTPWKLVPALAALLTALYFSASYAFEHRYWILLAAPALGTLLAAALVTSYVVALERANRRAVQTILGKHVSKKVAETLLQQADVFLAGGKMPPRSNTVTVIFTDLAGFSTASEKLTPEQTLRWLNEYMDVMVGLVERHDGSVNKFIGDAIMAVFGAPLASNDPKQLAHSAAQAVRCALQMRREVPILNERWQKDSPDLPPVAMRVGVVTGELVHGSMGTSDRMEWTVIGDTVNRANRLEAAGKEIKDQLSGEEKLCPILIGPETFERVGHLFVTEPVPNMALKGISERVTVYRVLSELASPPPQPNQPL